MNRFEKLQTRRQELMDELAGLEQMRRGSVMEQFVETVKKDGTKGRRGPYFLYTYKEKGKTVSRRLPSRRAADLYRNQIQAFRRFRKITSELLVIGEQLGELSVFDKGSVKKTPKSPSNRTGK